MKKNISYPSLITTGCLMPLWHRSLLPFFLPVKIYILLVHERYQFLLRTAGHFLHAQNSVGDKVIPKLTFAIGHQSGKSREYAVLCRMPRRLVTRVDANLGGSGGFVGDAKGRLWHKKNWIG